MSNFKIILTGIFIFCIIIGLGLFALSKGNSSGQKANLVMWGSIPYEVFETAYKNSSLFSNKQIKISYVKKDSNTFDADFVEALASGVGPDIIISRDDSIYKEQNKLFIIPYKNYTERDFKDRFIEGGELFLSSEGIISLPFIVDPLVMYWNRDMFSTTLFQNPQSIGNKSILL